MRLMQVRSSLAMYAGLFGTWSVNGHHVTAAKVVLATVHTGPAGPAPVAALGDLPWVVLQLQTVDRDKQPDLWNQLESVLRAEFAAPFHDRSAERCPGRIVFDNSQDVHNIRPFADRRALTRYRIERIDRHNPRLDGECCDRPATTGNKDARPVTTIQHDRIEYRVLVRNTNDVKGWVAAPLAVWVERCRPRHMLPGPRMHQDYGYVREGTLLGAAGEFRTWIVIAGGP